MKRINTLRAKTGTYTDQQTGAEKTSYMTIGHVLQGDRGQSIKIDSIPVNWDGWAYVGDLESQRAKQAAQPTGDEELPF